MKPKQKKKLKRYYIKPYKGVWLLTDAEKTLIGSWRTKRESIRKASYIIRSHGGGTLRIMLKNGRFQEERTYPKAADPKRSKG